MLGKVVKKIIGPGQNLNADNMKKFTFVKQFSLVSAISGK
jgi:hypothetical protein